MVTSAIRHSIGVACITDKIDEARLRWYRHVERRHGDNCVKCILKAEVQGCQSRRRQKKRWINTMSQDHIILNLTPVDSRGLRSGEPV